MNYLILVRHGGSTGSESKTCYGYNESAICVTTSGIEHARETGSELTTVEPRWAKPGNSAPEVFAHEYTRAQKTAPIARDQAGLLSTAALQSVAGAPTLTTPRLRPLASPAPDRHGSVMGEA